MEMENNEVLNKSAGIGRIKCIDALRGIVVAIMILCDSPGNPDRVYIQLRHATWNGVTFADFGFPFFIIIMGIVVPNAINRRIEKGLSLFKIFIYITKRSVEIFALGLVLNGFPFYDFSSIRILGVLQRISIVYFVISMVTLVIAYMIKNKLIQTAIQLGLAFTIVLIYFLLMKYVNVPGFGRGILEPDGNLAQYVDLHWLKGHLYRANWDPEGILSTLPAIASGLFGIVLGQILTYGKSKKIYKALFIFSFGTILLALAFIVNIGVPFNKNLWSSSFVLLTAGMAFLVVAVIYFIIDIIKYESIFKPFIFLGSSSIVVYMVAEIIGKSLWVIPITDPISNVTVTLNVWLTNHFITPWAGRLDSAYFGAIYIVIWMGIMGILYNFKRQKKI